MTPPRANARGAVVYPALYGMALCSSGELTCGAGPAVSWRLKPRLERHKVRLRGMPFTLFTVRITLWPYPSSWGGPWHAPERYVSERESGSMI